MDQLHPSDPTRSASNRAGVPAWLPWSFEASVGPDKPFHGLVSEFGADVIMDLDQVILETPVKAAVRATRVFQQYSSQIGRDNETRGVMAHLASAIKPNADLLDEVALLPPEAVFHGFSRPRT